MAISLKNNIDRDQWQILAAYDEYSSLQRYYVYGNYIDEVLVMNDGADDTYYAHDHLYSPVALLDDTGTVVERYEYDAYGKAAILAPNYALRTTSLYANPFTFTGRQLDILDNGNLHHMHYRHRDYSPQLGRFMQHDPLGMQLEYFAPKRQYLNGCNLFLYVTNNPIRYSDPSGEDPVIGNPIIGLSPEGIVVLVALSRCGLPYYAASQAYHSDQTDKFRHCWTSCMIARDCGQVISRLAGMTKEARDIIEGIIRGKLDEVAGDSLVDIFANSSGYKCAGPETWVCGLGNITRWFRDSCESCCGDAEKENWGL